MIRGGFLLLSQVLCWLLCAPVLAQSLTVSCDEDDSRLALIEGRTFQMGLDDTAVERLITLGQNMGGNRCEPRNFERERGDQVVTVAPFILYLYEVIGDRAIFASWSDEVLWPNTACGVRHRITRTRVTWMLREEDHQWPLAEKLTRDEEAIGLEFQTE